SSVPQTDRSTGLTNYPTDLLNSPPQLLSAAIQFHYPIGLARPAPRSRSLMPPSSPTMREVTTRPVVAAPTAMPEPLRLQANQQATPRSAFTELITTRRLSLWFLITAAFIAFGLGALHALEP